MSWQSLKWKNLRSHWHYPSAINSILMTAQVPCPHLGAWRRMLTFYFTWASPPPPYGRRLPGRLRKSFYFFGFYLKFLLVKMTSWWPLRSSAEMVHEIQVWLIIISQPKSSYWKLSPAGLVLGSVHDVIKEFGSIHSWTWLEKDLCSLFPWWGGGGRVGGWADTE